METITTTTRICSSCREDKPFSEFYKDKKGKFGIGRRCRSCENIHRNAWYQNNKSVRAQRQKDRYAADPDYYKKRIEGIRSQNPKRAWAWFAASRLRIRAKKLGIPICASIDSKFLESIAPDICPVLGLRLFYPTGTRAPTFRPDNPSVDKIIPRLGYVPGNVVVISRRANLIKTDASADEVLAVGRWLKSITETGQ